MRANQYRRGYVTYRADLTELGKQYAAALAGKHGQKVILGRYRYVATKIVRDPNDKTQATIFYSQELVDPTPFYGKVDREGGQGKIVEPTGGRVDVYYDGQRWRVRR
jgi:hypothetical protein